MTTGEAPTIKRLGERLQFPKIEHRLHDTVDLATGKVETRAVAGSLSPIERVEQLARFGKRFNPHIFGSPTYRLTPQRPYQSQPEAWLDAFDGTYGAGPGVDQIWWRLPSSFATEFVAGCNFSFQGFAAGPAVLSLVFEAWPYQGRTGTVVIDIHALRTEIPISVAGARTTDISFVHDGASSLLTMVFFRPGIYDFVFHSVSLGQGLVVAHPTASG
jgi:hypothetical protein